MAEFSPDRLKQDVETVVRFLEQHRIPYILIGGLALNLWGRPRTTLDLDFLIQAEEQGLKRLKHEASKKKFKIDRKWMDWNPLLKKSQIRLQIGKVAIDFLAPRDAHDKAAIQRGKRCKIGKKSCLVVAPEDFVLQKLKIGRPRDFEDAVTVLERMQGKLDKRYLKRWSKKLGIAGELDYILNL